MTAELTTLKWVEMSGYPLHPPPDVKIEITGRFPILGESRFRIERENPPGIGGYGAGARHAIFHLSELRFIALSPCVFLQRLSQELFLLGPIFPAWLCLPPSRCR